MLLFSDNDGVNADMQVFDKKAIVLDADIGDDKLKSQIEKFKKIIINTRVGT